MAPAATPGAGAGKEVPAPAPPRQNWRMRFRSWWEKTFPVTDKDAEAKVKADDGDTAWVERLEKVLAGLTAGLGGLGLVIFAGGAVQWARFDRVGLPADQAVAAVPREELIAVGSASLMAFLILGGVAVLGAYLVSRGGRPTRGLTILLAGLGVTPTLYSWFLADVSTLAPFCILGLGLSLAGLCLALGARTGERFRWLAVAVFLSAGIMGIAVAYAVNYHDPQVQPAAAVRGPDDLGVVGVYVALNDKRLVLGTTEKFDQPLLAGVSPAGLIELPCSDVTSLSIGALRSHDRGTQDVARRLLSVLLDIRTRGQKPAKERAISDAPKADAPKADASESTGAGEPSKSGAGEAEADVEKPALTALC